MPSPDEVGARKLSRRRFVESAGALAAAGVIGIGLEAVAGPLLGQASEKTAADPAFRASTARAEVPKPRTTSPMYRTIPVAPPVAASPFSIFWITDTQFLSESNPLLYSLMTSWIVDNWTRFNGKLVIHTGDVVQDGTRQVEWENANEAMSILLQNGIPYTWCAGNHDNVTEGDPISGWNGNQWAQSFNPPAVMDRVNALKYTNWVSDYHTGMNTAVKFTANGLNFLVVNIEWEAQPDVLEWVGNVLNDPAYADHSVIIAPHAYIDAYGMLNDPRYGATLSAFTDGLTGLMDASPNVFLTLNGHFASECGYNTPAPVNGRNELMFDRQDCTDDPNNPTGRGVDSATPETKDGDKVGGATVTILTFDTANNKASANTYDVYTSNWRTDADERYAFKMFSTGGAGSSSAGGGTRGTLP